MSTQTILTQSATVAISDRSFSYGDGCFTTMVCEGNSVQYLEFHLLRLEQDSRRLFFPELDLNALRKAIIEFAETLNQKCVVKVHISRGKGGRGYALPSNVELSIQITSHPFAKSTSHELHVGISKVRLSSQPMLAGIKHCNRLEQILAKAELQQTAYDDFLMCDPEGNVVEATSANLFLLIDGQWFTPILDRQGVEGVMKKVVMQKMQENNIKIFETRIPMQKLSYVQSAFVTNAVFKIRPINSLDLGTKQISFDTLAIHKITNLIG